MIDITDCIATDHYNSNDFHRTENGLPDRRSLGEQSPRSLELCLTPPTSCVGVSTIHTYATSQALPLEFSNSTAVTFTPMPRSSSPSHDGNPVTPQLRPTLTPPPITLASTPSTSPRLEFSPSYHGVAAPREVDRYTPPTVIDMPNFQCPTVAPKIFNPAFDIPFRPNRTLPLVNTPAGEAIDLSTRQNGTAGVDRGRHSRQPSVTVCYTYDAFFISDGRSKKKVSIGSLLLLLLLLFWYWDIHGTVRFTLRYWRNNYLYLTMRQTLMILLTPT